VPPAKIPNPRPSTLYRAGVREGEPKRVHTLQSRQWRRAVASALFDAPDRSLFLQALRLDRDLATAAARVGVSLAQVYGRMRWDTSFSAEVETVLAELCANAVQHHGHHCGTTRGYREGGRCADCRAAKARDRGPRGR
jgi:hypothetical protein